MQLIDLLKAFGGDIGFSRNKTEEYIYFLNYLKTVSRNNRVESSHLKKKKKKRLLFSYI